MITKLRTAGSGFRFDETFWTRSLCSHRDDANLLQQSQHIEVEPAFCNAAVLEAEDDDPGDGDCLAGSGRAHERTVVMSRRFEAPGHLIAFGDQVFDSKVQVGEGGEIPSHKLLQRLTAIDSFGPGLVLVEIRLVEFIDQGCVLLIPAFFDPAAYNGFVLFCGHTISPFVNMSLFANLSLLYSAERSETSGEHLIK